MPHLRGHPSAHRPPQDEKQTSKSKVAVYDTEIKAKLKAGQNARSIYQDLYVEETYRGSYDSVKRYVRKLKKDDPKLHARIETLAGVEAQVNFGLGAPTLKNGLELQQKNGQVEKSCCTFVS